MSEIKRNLFQRYTDEELGIIKNTFVDNVDLLIAIRNHILQLKNTAVQLGLIATRLTGKKDVLKVLRKKLLPELDPEIPLGQQQDLFLTIPVKDMYNDQAIIHIKAVKIWYDYMDQQLSILEDKKVEKPFRLSDLEFSIDKTNWDLQIDLIARNLIIAGTEQMLNTLSIDNTITAEELEKRNRLNSTK